MFQYGKNFWILCCSMFFFMTSFNLIIPELNGFITQLQGASYKGLIFVFFTLTACISRPFSGKLADKIGRKKVMFIGMLFAVLISLLYPLSFSVLFFLILRLLHGFSAGFFPTGATALITDLLPDTERGKGMGVWGMFISLGIGVGQGLGSLITTTFDINTLFLIAGGTALISGILNGSVKETLPHPRPFRKDFLRVGRNEIVDKSVLPAAVVMFLSATCSGIIFVIVPDFCDYLHIENKGTFFIYYVFTTLLIRFLCGSLSDVIGRRKTLLLGMFFLIISMYLIGSAITFPSFILGAILFGVATGISSPTLFAWTADLSHIDRRGIGSGTMFMALELGIMVGAFSTLLTYDNTIASVPAVFFLGTAFALAALLYLLWHLKFKSSRT
jgi:MFS family permease